jgi:hypothetical protein
LIALCALAPNADASLQMWPPGGVATEAGLGPGESPMAVSDGAGGVFVVWRSLKIRMQHLGATGAVAPGWDPANGRVVCDEPVRGGWPQTNARAIPDGSGGLFVLWNDQRNMPCTQSCLGDPCQLFLQRFSPSGSIATGWPALGVDVGSALTGMISWPFGWRDSWVSLNPTIVSDGAGGALIAWTEGLGHYNFTPLPGVHVQRVSGAGARLWGEHGVVVCALPIGAPAYPFVASDENGGAFVAWQDERDSVAGSRIYLQHVSSTGQTLMESNGRKLDSVSAAAERLPQLVRLPSGGLMVVRESGGSCVVNSLVVSVEADGASGLGAKRALIANGTVITNTALPEGSVSVLRAPGGGAWVSWTDVRDPENQAIYLQRLLNDGSAAANWPATGLAIGGGPLPSISIPMLAEDGLNGAYVAWRDQLGPRAVRITAAGSRARGWPEQGVPLGTGNNWAIHIVPDSRHGAIVVWDEWDTSDVRAQRLAPLDITPFAMTPPAPLAAPQGPPSGGAQLHAGGTAFEIRPNPTRGTIRIEMALARTEPAAIDVFDLVGRRVAHRDVAPGAQTLTIQEAESLTPGLYVVRLTQGDLRIVRRAIVSR